MGVDLGEWVSLSQTLSAMASSDDAMWMDNLEEWIMDENKIISAKFLSRALRVHVNTAKERLFHFANTAKDPGAIEVVLLLAGTDRQGRRRVRLARRSQEREAGLEELTSKHVYAVARKEVLSAAEGGGAAALTAAVLDASREGDAAVGAALAAVANRAAVPRGAGAGGVVLERPSISNEPRKPMPPPKPKAKAKEPSPKKGAKPEEAKKEADKKDDKNVKPAAPAAKSKSTASAKGKQKNIAGMFANAATKKRAAPAKASKAKEEVKEDGSPGTSPGKENRDNEEREKKAKEEEQEDQRKTRSTAKGRKRIQVRKYGQTEETDLLILLSPQVMADSDSSDEEDKEEEEEEEEDEPEPEPEPEPEQVEEEEEGKPPVKVEQICPGEKRNLPMTQLLRRSEGTRAVIFGRGRDPQHPGRREEGAGGRREEAEAEGQEEGAEGVQGRGRVHRRQGGSGVLQRVGGGRRGRGKKQGSSEKGEGHDTTKYLECAQAASVLKSKDNKKPEPAVKEPAAKKARKSPTKASGSKQASIMNFFKKK